MQTQTEANESLPAPLLALASQTGLYRVAVEGDGLSPRYRHNDHAIILPAIGRNPEGIEPGSIVLVATSDEGTPDFFSRASLYTLNADLDLVCGKSIVPHGRYLVLGIAR